MKVSRRWIEWAHGPGAEDGQPLAMSLCDLAGAPGAPTAGLDLHVKLGDEVTAGMPLFTLHAQARGELTYAQNYLASHPFIELSQEVTL